MLGRGDQQGNVTVVEAGDGVLEFDGLGSAVGVHVGLDELAVRGGEADLESFGFAGQAFRSASAMRARRLSRMSSRRH